MKAVRQPTQKQDAPFEKRSMKDTTITQIRCPCCDDAVRPLDATPCPECRGCPFCGQKLARRETNCDCGQADNPKRVAALKKRFGIPKDRLASEKQRTGQGRLSYRQAVIYGLAGGLMVFTGNVYSDLYGPHSFGHRLLAAAVIIAVYAAPAKLVDLVLDRRSNAVR